jgi:hypothetical protein
MRYVCEGSRESVGVRGVKRVCWGIRYVCEGSRESVESNRRQESLLSPDSGVLRRVAACASGEMPKN